MSSMISFLSRGEGCAEPGRELSSWEDHPFLRGPFFIYFFSSSLDPLAAPFRRMVITGFY